MIVLDASVLIAHLDGADAHHAAAVRALRDAASDPFAASVVTLAEVLVGPVRAGAGSRARHALHLLEVTAVPLGTDTPERLASLRAGSGLRMPDCCVLLAADDVGASAVLTFDARLEAAARASGYATDVRRGRPSRP